MSLSTISSCTKWIESKVPYLQQRLMQDNQLREKLNFFNGLWDVTKDEIQKLRSGHKKISQLKEYLDGLIFLEITPDLLNQELKVEISENLKFLLHIKKLEEKTNKLMKNLSLN